ncbi:hypothetical protein L3V83_00645 [Thiotrichales bacterium 19X7-9]|nr:hypothetical protein [Thiotrichales bacterium 19X7-9]
MRKDGTKKYRNCLISYSVYGDNGHYSASGSITIHSDDVYHPQFNLNDDYASQNLAENTIIKECMDWIDDQIDNKKTLTPIKI